MSMKNKVAVFSVLAVLALAIILDTIIVVGSVSAQDSTEQQSSEDGINGTANSGNSTNSTAAGTKVSIVEEASEMGDQAYNPNPVKVKSGDTVAWTNNDSQIHTVTSGIDSSDPNMGKVFDSSMLSQNQTFSYKFTNAGEFSYFCELHPTMVGKVVVS
jgi:plastocyanin